jgi:hypothetical protein
MTENKNRLFDLNTSVTTTTVHHVSHNNSSHQRYEDPALCQFVVSSKNERETVKIEFKFEGEMFQFFFSSILSSLEI